MKEVQCFSCKQKSTLLCIGQWWDKMILCSLLQAAHINIDVNLCIFSVRWQAGVEICELLFLDGLAWLRAVAISEQSEWKPFWIRNMIRSRLVFLSVSAFPESAAEEWLEAGSVRGSGARHGQHPHPVPLSRHDASGNELSWSTEYIEMDKRPFISVISFVFVAFQEMHV